MENKFYTKEYLSWKWIIVVAICFWPVAIILMVKKLKREALHFEKNGKIVRNVGFVCLFFVLLAFKSYLETTTDFSAVLAWSFLIIPCYYCIVRANKYITYGKKYSNYYEVIEHRKNIADIASFMNKSYDETYQDLKDMIQFGILQNTKLDKQSGMLIHTTKTSKKTTYKSKQYATTSQVSKEVICPNCGAANEVTKGTSIECEYCGTKLKY